MSTPLTSREESYKSILRDRMRNADLPATARATFAIVDRIQAEPGEVQALAVSCAFIKMAERLGLRTSECLDIAHNIMESAEGTRPEFRGVAAFFKNELGA